MSTHLALSDIHGAARALLLALLLLLVAHFVLVVLVQLQLLLQLLLAVLQTKQQTPEMPADKQKACTEQRADREMAALLRCCSVLPPVHSVCSG